jgi:lysophospholipase L1-like esterase
MKMRKELFVVAVLALWFRPLCGSAWNMEDMISHWRFGKGVDTTAYDSVGTKEGTFYGNISMTGRVSSAFSFKGQSDYISMTHTPVINITGDITISAWVYLTKGGLYQAIVTKCVGGGDEKTPYDFRTNHYDEPLLAFIRSDVRDCEHVDSSVKIPIGKWHHILIRIENKVPEFYVNGIIVREGGDIILTRMPTSDTNSVPIGGRENEPYSNGIIKDVRVYKRALSEEEIRELFKNVGNSKASNPKPADGAMNVDPNVVLGWVPGQDILSYDVYFGTSYDDVNNADKLSGEYKGNYEVNSYDPCGLDLGTTYYWRIDEVSAVTTWPGDVWSFATVDRHIPSQSINIMTLGDSITQGHISNFDNYRHHLWHKLQENNCPEVNFVGSHDVLWDNVPDPATDFDKDHEGHGGWRTDHILYGGGPSGGGSGELDTWLNDLAQTNEVPDIVLIHLGTNDYLQGGQSGSEVVVELKAVIDLLRNHNEDVSILLGQIIPGYLGLDLWARDDLNPKIANLDTYETPTSKVIIVDHYTDFSTTWLADGLHPNTTGAAYMADKWYGALEPLLSSPDMDNNGDVDFVDFGYFTLLWQETDCGLCKGADLANGDQYLSQKESSVDVSLKSFGDGIVDHKDLAVFVENWLAGY